MTMSAMKMRHMKPMMRRYIYIIYIYDIYMINI